MWGRDGHDAHQSYDALDEYETDENNQEDEEAESEEEEEDPKPTKEELDYLKMREQIKEKIRQKYRKENAKAFGPTYSKENGKMTSAKFGSFFGPSQIVIAPRVIEESRSVRETQHIVAKAPSSFSGGKHASMSVETRTVAHGKPHKAVNELKSKVQALKSMRDYSFLLSDDADLPGAAKSPASRKVSNATSDIRSGPASPKARMSMGKPVKRISDGHISKDSFSRDQFVQTKAGQQKTAPPIRPRPYSNDTRKLLESKGGSSHGQPMVCKTTKDTRKLVESKGRNGHGQSMVSTASPRATAQGMVRKMAFVADVSKASIEKAPLLKKRQLSHQDHYKDKSQQVQDLGKAKVLPKQTLSSLKPQLPQPSKQAKERIIYEDKPERRPSKKPMRDPFDEDDDDIDDPMSFLRNKLLSRFNSSKYQVDDEDDSDMEANFDEIMMEERRSSKIAMQEDEEQLRLIEEEERRERMRREAKKRKLMQR